MEIQWTRRSHFVAIFKFQLTDRAVDCVRQLSRYGFPVRSILHFLHQHYLPLLVFVGVFHLSGKSNLPSAQFVLGRSIRKLIPAPHSLKEWGLKKAKVSHPPQFTFFSTFLRHPPKLWVLWNTTFPKVIHFISFRCLSPAWNSTLIGTGEPGFLGSLDFESQFQREPTQ